MRAQTAHGVCTFLKKTQSWVKKWGWRPGSDKSEAVHKSRPLCVPGLSSIVRVFKQRTSLSRSHNDFCYPRSQAIGGLPQKIKAKMIRQNEARHTRSHITWLHFYRCLEQVNLTGHNIAQCLGEVAKGGGSRKCTVGVVCNSVSSELCKAIKESLNKPSLWTRNCAACFSCTKSLQ